MLVEMSDMVCWLWAFNVFSHMHTRGVSVLRIPTEKRKNKQTRFLRNLCEICTVFDIRR